MIRNEEEEEEKMEVEQDPSELTTELVNSRDQLVRDHSLTHSLSCSFIHSLYSLQPWFDAAVQLLDHLCRNENSPPFLLPVDTEIFPVSEMEHSHSLTHSLTHTHSHTLTHTHSLSQHRTIHYMSAVQWILV